MELIFNAFDQEFDLKTVSPASYSPLVLAYIGDGIYELLIRTYLVKQGNAPVDKLNARAKNYVKASAQAKLFFGIEELLTEDELKVFKRGRNAKSGTKAKNAKLSDYKIATGVEALFGFLYLNKEFDRLMELVIKGIKDDETN